jgi:hypothetical protein
VPAGKSHFLEKIRMEAKVVSEMYSVRDANHKNIQYSASFK